jgi:cytochrome b561
MAGSTITAGKKAGTPLPATYVTASGLPRYHPVSQALHWVTAALALAVLPLAWVAVSLPPAPAKGSLFVLHKSVGLTILAIVVLRIVWRMIRPAPADPLAPRLLTLIGRVNHGLLYAIFLIMPISGTS